MERNTYLTSLPKQERTALAEFLKLLFADRLSRLGTFGALAVGTTTYPYEYWLKLERDLRGKDPEKLDFVQRRGEDIDIQLCSENCGYVIPEPEINEAVAEILEQKGIKFERQADRCTSRVSYLGVPPEYRAQHGQSVLRIKDVNYGAPNLRAEFEGARTIHIIYSFSECLDQKLQREESQGLPHVVLFRRNAYQEFRHAVERVNRQGLLFSPL